MSDVTRILNAFEEGDPSASEQLLPLVYDELRKLAASKMAQEKPGQTLQATALVHEAYLRLVDGKTSSNWQSRGQFFKAAAESMRRILIDAARRKKSQQAGGDMRMGSRDPEGAKLLMRETVSYGGRFTAERPTRVAVVPAGYADGIDLRMAGRGVVLVRGRRAHIVGAVCMDMILLDITDIEAYPGDEVVLLGTQDDEKVDVREMAASIGTILWEILCRLGSRIERIYSVG